MCEDLRQIVLLKNILLFTVLPLKEKLILSVALLRGQTAVNGAGLGVDRPAELMKSDDEYDAFRKRMMLAYRFRPNPLVTPVNCCFLYQNTMHVYELAVKLHTVTCVC